MRALKLTTNQKDKQKLDAKCKELLTRAEKIKQAKHWQSAIGGGDSNALRLQGPASTRKLTILEEIILLEGAKLNGFVFPPWVSSPSAEDFELGSGRELFTYVLTTDSYPLLRNYCELVHILTLA